MEFDLENERCATSCVDPDRIDRARAQLADSDAQQTARLFRLLGDPTRVRILQALVAGDELCVCDLAAAVDVSENTVSQALRLLRTAGAVRSRRLGRRVFYAVADHHVRLVLDLAVEHAGHDAPVSSLPGDPLAFGFVDLCGFTRLAEHHGDTEAAAQIVTFRQAVRDAAAESGVVVHRWLGDGAMLVASEPGAVVATARRFDETVGAAGAGLASRAGIAWGPAHRLEEDYIGRAANLASRLCERAAPHQLLVDEAALARLEEDPDDLRVEHLRGIPTPITFGDLGRCGHSETRVIDPICGMELAPSLAVEVIADGNTAWFCSTGCADRWNPPGADEGKAAVGAAIVEQASGR